MDGYCFLHLSSVIIYISAEGECEETKDLLRRISRVSPLVIFCRCCLCEASLADARFFSMLSVASACLC